MNPLEFIKESEATVKTLYSDEIQNTRYTVSKLMEQERLLDFTPSGKVKKEDKGKHPNTRVLVLVNQMLFSLYKRVIITFVI